MRKISLRTADLTDLKNLLAPEQEVVKSERPLDSFLGTGELYYYNIPKLISSENIPSIVAVSNKELVASSYLKMGNSNHYHKNAKHGCIDFIYVKPSSRGQRISNLILESLKN
tara:strand:+ start:1345 stop:1683 length:339 start_codon:yes stop_codon:yes gene_type:complete